MSTLNLLPFRAKVSADFGTVNTDISTATTAGTTYTGTARTAPTPVQGVLFNLNVDPSLGDLNVEVLFGSQWVGFSPMLVKAGGFTGWAMTPVNGFGFPTGYSQYRAVWVSNSINVSVIVTSQLFDY